MKQFTSQDLAAWNSSFRIYADRDDLVDAPLWWHTKGLQQTASGYGRKLTTRYKISFEGRLYRVYCTCFSNSGTLWFKTGGREIVIS